jgi:Tfp pilus assembly protein PilN
MALREINLISAQFLYKKYLFRHLFLWTGSLFICLSLIFGFYLYQVNVVLPKKRPKTTLEDMHKQLGATIDEIKETQQEIQRLSLQESFLTKLDRLQPFSRLLLKLSEIMNAQTWLTKFTIDAETEDEEAVSSIKLYGYSLTNNDLGNFMTLLSGESLFKDVILKIAKESEISKLLEDRNTPVKVIQFQVDCKIPRS